MDSKRRQEEDLTLHGRVKTKYIDLTLRKKNIKDEITRLTFFNTKDMVCVTL